MLLANPQGLRNTAQQIEKQKHINDDGFMLSEREI
jgi:hypothetical protein